MRKGNGFGCPVYLLGMAEPHPEVIDPQHPLVRRLREICLAYPEAAEIAAWGRPTFRAGKKIFLFVAESMDRPYSIVFKPTRQERLAYLEDPRFFVPAYWGPSGWMATDIGSPETDWSLVEELVDTSYRQVALVRQLRELDARG